MQVICRTESHSMMAWKTELRKAKGTVGLDRFIISIAMRISWVHTYIKTQPVVFQYIQCIIPQIWIYLSETVEKWNNMWQREHVGDLWLPLPNERAQASIYIPRVLTMVIT